MPRVAVIFDDQLRPETTGTYCRAALAKLGSVDHFQPSKMREIPRLGYDLYLSIDDGLEYEFPRDLRPAVRWAIDTHVDFDRSLRMARGFDLVFAAQRDGAERLIEAGIPSARWLPLACDPVIHRPHRVKKKFDVAFVGNVFRGPRAELLQAIQRAYPATFVGNRYFEAMAKTYSLARLSFNRSIANDVNMRVFEAAACGSLLLTNDLADTRSIRLLTIDDWHILRLPQKAPSACGELGGSSLALVTLEPHLPAHRRLNPVFVRNPFEFPTILTRRGLSRSSNTARRHRATVDPLGRRATLSHDLAGQRVLRIDARGYRTTYPWDDDGRLLGRRYPDGTRVTFGWDAAGQRLLAHDTLGRYSTLYDAAGQIRATATPANKRITYLHDALGQRRVMIDPDGGRFSYLWDDRGLNRGVHNPFGERTTLLFDALGQETVKRLANGTRASSTWDAAGQLTFLGNYKSDGTVISSFDTAFDPIGNPLRSIEADAVRVTWAYDNTSQLIRERRSGTYAYDTTYGYDAAANRRVKIDSGARTTYTCDAANQLTKFQDSTGVTTLTWDANGNQRSQLTPAGQRTTNSWDFENRLSLVQLPTGARATQGYDPFGLRVKKDDADGFVKFIWDEQCPLTETSFADSTQALYSRSIELYGALVSQHRTGTSRFFHFQPQSSTRQLTSSAQSITDTYLYSAFGVPLHLSGNTANFARFGGQTFYQFNQSTDLLYIRARWLAPTNGRWQSPDLVDFADGFGVYRYAGNCPPRFIDPSGLLPFAGLAIGAGLGCLGGGVAASLVGWLRGRSPQNIWCRAAVGCLMGIIPGAIAGFNPAMITCMLGTIYGLASTIPALICDNLTGECKNPNLMRDIACAVLKTLLASVVSCFLAPFAELTIVKGLLILNSLIWGTNYVNYCTFDF
jgi:RHS repeat-associated protein